MRGRRGSALLTIIGVVTSLLVYASLMFGSLWSAAPGPLRSLRTAFWHDQLGYLSIVANVASGDFANHEPVTETGVNHYPRTYYSLVGMVARVFHIDSVFAWNLTSVSVQLAAVAALAFALARISRRPWMAFLAPLPFFAGVYAFTRDGGWFRELDSHAVLWGPYGVMFSNNAETAGLSVIIASLSVLAAIWLRPTGHKTRVALTLVCALLLGVLSGFQTYSFLSGAYVMAYLLAAQFLRPSGRRWWIVATFVGFVTVVAVGPVVAQVAGQLPTLVFGLLPALPGLIRGAIRTRGMLALYVAAFSAAALPQIIWTTSGIIAGDPFLTYRVASNVDLGVLRLGTLIASVVVALPLTALLVFSIRRRGGSVGGFAGAALVTWAVLALNDLWGANAEPYRFWIDMFLLCGVVALLAAATFYARAVPGEEPTPARSAVPWRRVQALVWTICALIYAVSLTDYAVFRADAGMTATWDPTAPREEAIAALSEQAEGEASGLILTDGCIDVRTAKVSSAAPFASYYLGMAWPAERDAVQEVMDAAASGLVTAEALGAASVTWILTDAACESSIRATGGSLIEAGSMQYGADKDDVIRLYRYSAQ